MAAPTDVLAARSPSFVVVGGEWCDVEATVVTGLEQVASEEAVEHFNTSVEVGRGNILISLPIKSAPKVLKLHSVDNCAVLIYKNPHIGFSENEVKCMEKLQNIVKDVDWPKGLQVWSEFFTFSHPIESKPPHLPEKYDDIILSSSIFTPAKKEGGRKRNSYKRKKNRKADGLTADTHTENLSMNDTHNTRGDLALAGTADEVVPCKKPRLKKTIYDPTKPTFRVTCYRTGDNHCFHSMCAAANFGGAIQKYFNWNVDMKNFDIEVLLNIEDQAVSVSIALTRESLHHRHISSFGPTTLRPTTAYNMLRICKIQPGEVVCDPMCGSGSIPIQAAVSWPDAVHLCGEIHPRAITRVTENVRSMNENRSRKSEKSLHIDLFRWNACHLPLKDESVDVFITDLPFGKRIGSKKENWKLYPAVLNEMARTCKLETGRACLLTQDKKCMIKCMQAFGKYWRKQTCFWVNIGGLAAGIYLLRRTCTKLDGSKIPKFSQVRSVADDDGSIVRTSTPYMEMKPENK